MPFSIIGDSNMLDLSRATSAEYYLERNAFILGKLDSLTYTDKLIAIKPFDLLCDDGYCPAVKGNTALYFDDDHLSISGGMIIADKIMENAGSMKLPSL